jgi:WD40 repeat protein
VPAIVAECEVPLLARFKVSLDFRRPEREHWESEVGRLRRKLAAREEVPGPEAGRCPYPGMRAFEAREAADFHGRAQEVEEALMHVRGGVRELYVIGPSGSGKSSLVAAGLVPKLQSAPALGGGRYVVRTMRPGAEPLTVLTRALEAAEDGEEGAGWETVVAQLLERSPGCDRLLLFIDQLEELFTTAQGASRETFEAALRQLRRDERVVLVLTLRADFYGALMESALWEDVGGRPMRLDVAPLRGPRLRQAIEAPARAVGVHFEPVLVERLLQEVQHEAGALPLLQDTLLQLWHRRTRLLVRLADYEGLGDGDHSGLAVTVKQRADRTLNELTPARQELARRVLLRLVQFGEGEGEIVTRRQQTRAALAAAGDEAEEVNAVIRHLADRRLVTTSEGGESGDWVVQVDLAHEVLLRAWPALKEWIRTRREDEQWRRVLEGKADEWVRNGRGQTRLLDAEELQEAHAWLTQEVASKLGPSEAALALVTASEAAERQREQARQEQDQERFSSRRRFAWLVIVALMVFSILGLVVWGKWEEAQQQRKATKQQLAFNVLEQARGLLVEQSKLTFAIPLLQRAIALGIDNSVLRTVLATLRHHVWEAVFFHGDSVQFAAFSSDGALVLTASWDHTARVWEVATGHALGIPLTHQSAVTSAAFSLDGRRVVTASRDHTARVWDVATGRALGTPLAHQDSVNSAAFSPDGSRVVTASDDKTARIWEAATGLALGPPLVHQDRVNSTAFSPDGTRVATASDDKTAQLWDGETGRALAAPLKHQDRVTSATFSSDGTRVVTASWDKTARVWDVATGRALGAPLEHQAPLISAAFSPDGARVVTTTHSRSALVWEVSTGRASPSLVHQDKVNSAAFSPDGTRVVTASDDKTAQVWDVATGRALGAPLEHQDRVNAAAFSPDGARVVTASDDSTARVWNVATGRAQGNSRENLDMVSVVAFSPDRSRAVTVMVNHAQVWDVATGHAVGDPFKHRTQVYSAAFSPDGARVVTASGDGTAQVWDVVTGRALGAPLEHRGEVNSAAFSPDGARVVTASQDRTARVWDVAMGRAGGMLLKHAEGVAIAAFSPDGTKVITASYGGTVQVWDAATVRVVGAPLAHQSQITSVAFSPDGARVVTASYDRTARVWDAATGRVIGAPLEHLGKVNSAAFSPDGAWVVTASDDKTARVWDVATGRAIGAVLEHQAEVTGAEFSSDGTRVVTSSYDGTARVWEAATGRALGSPLDHQAAVKSAAFSPDGARVVTASGDDTVLLWHVVETSPLADWSAQAQSCMVPVTEHADSLKCKLAQSETFPTDVWAHSAALVATGDQQMFSRVWPVPRATYHLALHLLDDPGGPSFDRQSRSTRRDELSRRLAVLDALEGELPHARERLGANAPTEDAALLRLLGATAHEELFNDFVALTLLRRASVLAPDDASILANLIEVYFSLSQFREAASTAARIDLSRVSPDFRVSLAALAWAATRLSQAPERAAAQQLLRAYAALSESMRTHWSWKGTRHRQESR